ncbi:MAG TPA: aminotransferase class III-fold pyridoxal phosphate-dependent enzyme, partial [Herpetosiphonaceae bacterium]
TAGMAAVGEVRGRGLMLGVELVRDRASAAPDPDLAFRAALECQRRGVLLLGGGMHGNVLSITPPFVIAEEALAAALETVAAVLGELAPTTEGARD